MVWKYCDMTPESQNCSLLGNGLVTRSAEANGRINRRAVFSVICIEQVATNGAVNTFLQQ
jgi:hypothetical protein